MYGQRYSSHDAIIQQYVKGKSVVDLGCGNGEWLPILREFGAAEVLGIDKDLPKGFRDTALRIDYASTVIDSPFVAVLFYPPNYRITGLVPLLEQAEIVIYRGCNTDEITACGGRTFFAISCGESCSNIERRNGLTCSYSGGSLDFLEST